MNEIPIACSLTYVLLHLTGPEGTAGFLGAELGFTAGGE
jgi:hypothetical protein